jgi:hypothetical protein
MVVEMREIVRHTVGDEMPTLENLAMNHAVAWEAVRRHLEAEKDAVATEIHAYPRPIAGCDAQFNYLLDRRRLLQEELARLETACGDRTAIAADFLQRSACLDAEAKRAILAGGKPVDRGPV